MKSVKKRTSKTAKKTPRVVQSSEVSFDLEKIPVINWNFVFRILGSVTGIAAVTGLLLWLLGYLRIYGYQEAISLPRLGYVSQTYEQTMVKGISFFISLITDIVFLLLIYFLVIIILPPFARYVTKLIREKEQSTRSWLAILYVIFVNATIASFSYLSFRFLTSNQILNAAATLVFIFALLGTGADALDDDTGLSLFFRKMPKILALFFCIVIPLTFRSLYAYESGLYAGCTDIVDSPMMTVFHSNTPLGIDGESEENGTYNYAGYYYLLADSNRYYLYRELDTTTLKPVKIFIVKNDAISVISLTKVETPIDWKLEKKCSDIHTNPIQKYNK